MKAKITIFLLLVSFYSKAQKRVYVESDVYQHTQADVDALYKSYCETIKTAWSYYYNDDYKTAIYYAKRVPTNIIDRDYLYSQKTQLLCMAYAQSGDYGSARKFYRKVRKKSPPNEIQKVEKVLILKGII
jgi:tetratricopeptide (TPR) repeat protein